MRPGDVNLAQELSQKLIQFSRQCPLPGIDTRENRDSFVAQLIDSIRRIKYVTTIRDKPMSSIYANATSEFFDPLKASAWNIQRGNTEEAFWLVFLLTHFGKNLKSGWALARAVYGALGNPAFWTWDNARADVAGLIGWLDQHNAEIKAQGSFGNHRKYTSLDAYKPAGTGRAFETYISHIGVSHASWIEGAIADAGNDPKLLFDHLYESLNAVVSFGRTAKFDYLTMVGKLGLVDIEPGLTYMTGATGPLQGAKLLFGGRDNARIPLRDLDTLLYSLESHIDLYFGMQVLEDALCNWHKSPSKYVYFRG